MHIAGKEERQLQIQSIQWACKNIQPYIYTHTNKTDFEQGDSQHFSPINIKHTIIYSFSNQQQQCIYIYVYIS